MGGEFFTDFKSLNGIEIFWLVQALSNFYWFWGSTPWGGGRWVHGGGGGYGCGGVSHAHACMHACTCMLNMLIMLNMDASMSAAICNFYTCIHVCMCMCVHVCAFVCVGGHPPCPQMPLTPPPPTLSTTSLSATSLTTTTRLVVLKSKKTELCPKYFSIQSTWFHIQN